MYGPPPDPRQVQAPVDLLEDPDRWGLAIGLGLLVSAGAWLRRLPLLARAALFILGQTVLLTAPLATSLGDTVYGAFPTIDKEGSLLFYLDGVHIRALLHPIESLDDPAARLIGVHLGHLWLVAALDLLGSTTAAFNGMALLSPALAWFAAFLLLRDLCGEPRVAMVLSFAWGTGLHVFRDLNWYTIEKAAIFWLALHAWALHRAWRDGGRWPWISGAIFGLMCWNNLYFGLSAGLLSGAAFLAQAAAERRSLASPSPALRGLSIANLFSLALALPLFVVQRALMADGPNLGDAERFLWERAALDGFSLVPFRWNRLEPWRALNLVAIGLGALALLRGGSDRRVRFGAAVALGLFLLSIGPALLPGPVHNPFYFAARAVIPGFWRMAKPESLFHTSYLLIVAMAAIELRARTDSRRGLALLYALFVAAWLVMVRSHPAFPDFSLPTQSALDPHWAERTFGKEAPP
jgi:hypothetical protein